MPFVRHRENSRIDWGLTVEGKTNPDRRAIELGCLLRIADATELMAKRHAELIAERDCYARWYEREQRSNTLLAHRLRGTRGAMTRAQRRISELQRELAVAKQAGTDTPAG